MPPCAGCVFANPAVRCAAMWGLLGQGGLWDKDSACADCLWKSAKAPGDVHHLFEAVDASQHTLSDFSRDHYMHPEDVVSINDLSDVHNSIYRQHTYGHLLDSSGRVPGARVSWANPGLAPSALSYKHDVPKVVESSSLLELDAQVKQWEEQVAQNSVIPIVTLAEKLAQAKNTLIEAQREALRQGHALARAMKMDGLKALVRELETKAAQEDATKDAQEDAMEDQPDTTALTQARAALATAQSEGPCIVLPRDWKSKTASQLTGAVNVMLLAVCPGNVNASRDSPTLEVMGLDRTCIVKCMLHMKLRIVGLILDKVLFRDLLTIQDANERTRIVKHLNKTHKSHVKWHDSMPETGGGKPFAMKVNGPSADLVLDCMPDTVNHIYSALDKEKDTPDGFFDRTQAMLQLAEHLRLLIYQLERGHWEAGTEEAAACVPLDCKRLALVYVKAVHSTSPSLFSANYLHEIFSHVSALFDKWTLQRKIPLGLLSMSVLESHHMYVGKNYFWAARMATVGGRNRKHTHTCGPDCSIGIGDGCPGPGVVVFEAPNHSFAGCGPSFHMLTGMIIQSHLNHICTECGGVRHLCCHHGCSEVATMVPLPGVRRTMEPQPPPSLSEVFLSDSDARVAAAKHDEVLSHAKDQACQVPAALPVPSFALKYLPPGQCWPQREHHEHYARLDFAVVQWDAKEGGEAMDLFLLCEQNYREISAVAPGDNLPGDDTVHELETDMEDELETEVPDVQLTSQTVGKAYTKWKQHMTPKDAKQRLRAMGRALEIEAGSDKHVWDTFSRESQIMSAVVDLLVERQEARGAV